VIHAPQDCRGPGCSLAVVVSSIRSLEVDVQLRSLAVLAWMSLPAGCLITQDDVDRWTDDDDDDDAGIPDTAGGSPGSGDGTPGTDTGLSGDGGGDAGGGDAGSGDEGGGSDDAGDGGSGGDAYSTMGGTWYVGSSCVLEISDSTPDSTTCPDCDFAFETTNLDTEGGPCGTVTDTVFAWESATSELHLFWYGDSLGTFSGELRTYSSAPDRLFWTGDSVHGSAYYGDFTLQ